MLDMSLHKANAFAVPRALFIPALLQCICALWELRCKTWEHDTHIGISPEL